MLQGRHCQIWVGSEYANPWISFSLSSLWGSKSFWLKREAHSNVMVRLLCLSVVQVLKFLTGVIPK